MAGEVYRKDRVPLAKSDGTPVARHLHAMMCEGYGKLEDLPVRSGAEVALHHRGQLVPGHSQKAPDSVASYATWLSREAGVDDSETPGRRTTDRE